MTDSLADRGGAQDGAAEDGEPDHVDGARLLERATLAGGTLTHTVTPGGDFELPARLPWR